MNVIFKTISTLRFEPVTICSIRGKPPDDGPPDTDPTSGGRQSADLGLPDVRPRSKA